MLIGIDANEANVKKKVGISEYAFQLLVQFNELKNLPAYKDLKFQIYLKGKPLPDLPPVTEKWQYKSFGPRSFWTQIALPFNLLVHKPRPDVFFTTSHYAPRFSLVPTVVSVMDLSYLYFPEMFKKDDLFQLKRWTAYSVKKATRVLTISESSKFDIMKEYKIPKEKVTVVYPGIKPAVSELSGHDMNAIKTKYGISDNFILFVGTLQPRKNIARLIESFAKVLKHEKIPQNLQLVIVGKKGWLYEEILNRPQELGIEEKVKFLNFVSDTELAIFYKHAICFALPSLYEGFGLPVLEAMRHDCPVITSNISSLPEAGGDAALYIDPNDVNDIAEKIEKLITNEKLRHELIEKGKKQLTKFSWEKTAKETLRVLEEIAQSNF